MKNDLAMKIATFGNNRMATVLGVSPQAVSKWGKRGEIPPRRVLIVAELLNMTPASLSPKVFGVTVKSGSKAPPP